MVTLYLTRRNLQTLLNKLDRARRDGPDASTCTIIKMDTKHPVWPCSDVVSVTALEDADYYTDREAGAVLKEDEPHARQAFPTPTPGDFLGVKDGSK